MFWKWFFRGFDAPNDEGSRLSNSRQLRPGFRSIINVYLVFHSAVSGLITYQVNPVLDTDSSVEKIAQLVVAPFTAVLISIAFTWTGTAFGLLQTKEVMLFTQRRLGGIAYYTYTFLLAVLVLLTASVLWAFAALGLFEALDCSKSVMFFLLLVSSIAVRETWHCSLAAGYLLIGRATVKEALNASPLEGQD